MLYSTDLRAEENIVLPLLAINGTTTCFNITINHISCDYTVEIYCEEPEVNILTPRTKIFIGADRPHCGKTTSGQLEGISHTVICTYLLFCSVK